MARSEFTPSRRAFLKSASSAVGLSAGGVVVVNASDTVAAGPSDGDTWDSSNYSGKRYPIGTEATYRDTIGAGLELIDRDRRDSYPLNHTFQFSQHGAVVFADSFEFATGSEWYKEENTTCVPPRWGANTHGQGFDLQGDTNIDIFLNVTGEGDESYVHPPTCDATETAVGLTTGVLGLATASLSGFTVNAALSTTSLLTSLMQTDSGNTLDASYYDGLLRGGAGAEFIVQVEEDTTGKVDIWNEFGQVTTGFSISVDGKDLSVYPWHDGTCC